MSMDLTLCRYRAGLQAKRFTVAEIAKASGMPLPMLKGFADGSRKPRSVSRLRPLLAALNRLDPKVKPHLASPAPVQAVHDPSRPVRLQIPDIERDLEAFGVPLAAVLTRAGVSRRRWESWRKGAEPRFSEWLDVLAAAQTSIELKAMDDAHARQPVGTGVA